MMCHRRHRGVSLIELVIFIIVVSVGLIGVLSAFNQSVRQSADPLVWKQALLVAEGMMNEILSKDFSPQPSTAARSNFNDVSDYNGYTLSGIVENDGTTGIAGLNSYSLAVAVTSIDFNSTDGAKTIVAADAKRITVTVSCGNQSVALTAFRTRYGS